MASGIFFPLLVRDQLFVPLGMRRSTYDRNVAITYPLALPHELGPDGQLRVEHRLVDNVPGNPAGFALSTARDLASLALMFLNGGSLGGEAFLRVESIREMWQPHAENGVRELASVRLNHPPGQTYEYANENYTTLGLIVQTVSGRSYEEYIQSAIFAPLHMRHSAAAIADPAVADLATGHRYRLSWPVVFAAPYPRQMTPAGFLISSTEDMAHYLLAHLNGGAYGDSRVLSPSGIATLHSAGATVSATSSYGMGWLVRDQPGAARLEHSGDVSNFHSNLLLFPDEQLGIVLLMNANSMPNAAANDRLLEGVAAILRGERLAERADAHGSWLGPMLPLAPLLVLLVWAAGSYLSIRRWQRRGELPPRGMRRLWWYGLPLGVDLGLATAAWLLVPRLLHTPVATIRLFAPDVYLSMALLSLLSLAWALARTVLTIRPFAKLR